MLVSTSMTMPIGVFSALALFSVGLMAVALSGLSVFVSLLVSLAGKSLLMSDGAVEELLEESDTRSIGSFWVPLVLGTLRSHERRFENKDV